MYKDEIHSYSINKIQFFSGLENFNIEVLYDLLEIRKYSSGDAIIKEGEKAEKIFFILKGEAVVAKQNEEGRLKQIALLEKGDYFGEMSFLDGGKRSASVLASTDLLIAELIWKDFEQHFKIIPDVYMKVLQNISQMLSVRLRAINFNYINSVLP